MRIAIVAKDDKGKEGLVAEHYGRAPFYAIIDSKTLEIKEIIPNKTHHFGGTFSPHQFLRTHDVQVIIVKEIGKNAIESAKRHDIRILVGAKETIQKTIEAYRNNELHEPTKDDPAVHQSVEEYRRGRMEK
jgi:predicted Fe-Mo cluster-binding NifX family protein